MAPRAPQIEREASGTTTQPWSRRSVVVTLDSAM